MANKYFDEQISEIIEKSEKFTALLYAMKAINITENFEDYEILSTRAALMGEVITCNTRHIVYGTTRIKKREYLIDAGKAQGIEIEYTDGVLEITLPWLLPKRKQRHSMEFLFDSLHYTLQEYIRTHRIPRFKNCVICCSCVYDKSRPLRRVRDHDNLELKQVIDIIATFALIDDSGVYCDTYNTAELGDKDCTRITVMDKEHFMTWLEERKKSGKSISNL